MTDHWRDRGRRAPHPSRVLRPYPLPMPPRIAPSARSCRACVLPAPGLIARPAPRLGRRLGRTSCGSRQMRMGGERLTHAQPVDEIAAVELLANAQLLRQRPHELHDQQARAQPETVGSLRTSTRARTPRTRRRFAKEKAPESRTAPPVGSRSRPLNQRALEAPPGYASTAARTVRGASLTRWL